MERWVAGQHLEGTGSQAVPIHPMVVLLLTDDLWGDDVRGTTDAPFSRPRTNDLGRVTMMMEWRIARTAGRRESKVGQFEVTVGGDEDVFGLEVSKDDPEFV